MGGEEKQAMPEHSLILPIPHRLRVPPQSCSISGWNLVKELKINHRLTWLNDHLLACQLVAVNGIHPTRKNDGVTRIRR